MSAGAAYIDYTNFFKARLTSGSCSTIAWFDREEEENGQVPDLVLGWEEEDDILYGTDGVTPVNFFKSRLTIGHTTTLNFFLDEENGAGPHTHQ